MCGLSSPIKEEACVPSLQWKADSLPLDHQGSPFLTVNLVERVTAFMIEVPDVSIVKTRWADLPL